MVVLCHKVTCSPRGSKLRGHSILDELYDKVKFHFFCTVSSICFNNVHDFFFAKSSSHEAVCIGVST
jgi:hypothetical protein